VLREKTQQRKQFSEQRAKEKAHEKEKRKPKKWRLDESKIFPFCSVYNLLLLA